MYLGQSASEKTVKLASSSGRLKRAGVIHFATHGLLPDESVMFIKDKFEPALLLTPPEKSDSIDDGLLTASEIERLEIGNAWIVLSACNTASGLKADGDAFSGLVRSFFVAGARGVVGSHWYVDSKATVDLIDVMFRNLTGKRGTGAEALQASMNAMILRGGRYAHPANWAPFVVVGID